MTRANLLRAVVSASSPRRAAQSGWCAAVAIK